MKKEKMLDKNMLGDTKADLVIVSILNQINNKRLTRRVCNLLGNSVSFNIGTIKFITPKKYNQTLSFPTTIYQLLKKHFREMVDEMDLYGYEQLRIPIQCSIASRLKKYFRPIIKDNSK